MKNMKPISATWFPGSEKTDVYRLLNMVHAMAGIDAKRENSSWRLKSTATYTTYVETTWTNGIVDVTAETTKDDDFNVIFHSYKMVEVTK